MWWDTEHGQTGVTQVARDLGSKCILSSVCQWWMCPAEPPLCGWSWKSSTNCKKKSSSREMLSLPRQVARARPSAIALFHTQGPACTQVRYYMPLRDNKQDLADYFPLSLIDGLCKDQGKTTVSGTNDFTEWWCIAWFDISCPVVLVKQPCVIHELQEIPETGTYQSKLVQPPHFVTIKLR